MQLACKSIETMYEVSTDKADVTCELMQQELQKESGLPVTKLL